MPKLALLAGGLATRMHPATLTLAKSMLPVAGEPFLGHQLRLLAAQGVREIVLCCGYLADQMREYAGDGGRWGCHIEYAADGAEPLGTGGALRNALPLLGDAFFVMYGDSYLRVSFSSVWTAFQASRRESLMTVFANEGRWDTSNVELGQGTILAYSKSRRTDRMRHIDYGLSCLTRQALEAWPMGARFDLADVMADLLRRDELAAYETHDRFFEIGSPQGLRDMQCFLTSLPTDLPGVTP